MRVEMGSAELAGLARGAACGCGNLLLGARRGVEAGSLTLADWQEAVDHVGAPFEVIGYSVRLALLGTDGVVYKASYTASGDAQFWEERVAFDRMADRRLPFCPDFWPYLEHQVMAMRRYRALDGHVVPDDYRDPHDEMTRVLGGQVKAANCGVDEDGRLVILDGGGEFPIDRYLSA